jgi:bacillithiol system protein YtxJ
MAKMRLEDKWDLDETDIYYLDLKKYRDISDAISEKLNVHHESPQLLLIRNRACIYDASHFDISVEELKESIAWHTST